MKKTLSFLIMVLFCFSISADLIPLEPKDPPKVVNGKDLDRSEILVPSASIEDGVINIETAYVYIRMNWGYSGEYDDTSYLAYYYSADAENINEMIYSPNWTILIPKENSTQVNEVRYNYITYMIYDTAEMSE